MKKGDTVRISTKNKNHLGYGVSAYAKMEGVVSEIWEDNSFCIECETSVLVVPLQCKRGIWIWLNGKFIFHKHTRPQSKIVMFFKKLLQ